MTKNCCNCNGDFYQEMDISSSSCPCRLDWQDMEDCRKNNHYRWHDSRWNIPKLIKLGDDNE